MTNKKLIVLFLFFGMYSGGYSQTVSFVQFKVNKISTAEEAKIIDDKIASKKGIISSRSDYVTSTYFCSVSSESDYTFEDFNAWFQKLGYEIGCYNAGTYGNTEMISPHELKKCEVNNNP